MTRVSEVRREADDMYAVACQIHGKWLRRGDAPKLTAWWQTIVDLLRDIRQFDDEDADEARAALNAVEEACCLLLADLVLPRDVDIDALIERTHTGFSQMCQTLMTVEDPPAGLAQATVELVESMRDAFAAVRTLEPLKKRARVALLYEACGALRDSMGDLLSSTENG